MDTRPDEPTSLAEELDLPEQLDDDAVPSSGPVRFARMAGSSIAGRDAAPWITDFLNAAYYRHPVAQRQVDDLRLAFSVLTTYWYREGGGRLRITDLRAFHRAFGASRFDTGESARGLLSREQLLEGAGDLIGDWFADAYYDNARRGWGIAFPTIEEKAAYEPRRRRKLAQVGELTPESASPEQQIWHTYPPVRMPSAEAVIGALTKPETWPDYASEIGRFTPLRALGLADQTFEIEVAAGTESGRPIFTRGYVTITELVTPDAPTALANWVAALEDGLARYGNDEPRAVPEGATPLVGFDLTTHQGHFMGNGHNRLLLYVQDGTAWVRAAGTWDPMPWHVGKAYAIAGEEAQHAFWGQIRKGDDSPQRVERLSMLHQLALRIA
jgi:hypothetical protein